MTTLMISIEGQAEEALQEMSAQQGIDPVEMASRFLKRAIRAARPKPVYDIPALQAAYAKFAAEDIAFSEASLPEHAELLAYEDCGRGPV